MGSDHFSVYYVGLHSEEGNGTGYVEPEDDITLFAGIAAVLVIVVIVIVVMIRRRS